MVLANLSGESQRETIRQPIQSQGNSQIRKIPEWVLLPLYSGWSSKRFDIARGASLCPR